MFNQPKKNSILQKKAFLPFSNRNYSVISSDSSARLCQGFNQYSKLAVSKNTKCLSQAGMFRDFRLGSYRTRSCQVSWVVNLLLDVPGGFF